MKPSELARLLPSTIAARLPVMITGAPGIGKSDSVEQACAAADADLILTHPGLSDPTDYKGLPYAKDGIADFLPYGDLRRMIDADRLTVVFGDDFGQAPPSVQAAWMQLVLARRVNGHRISDNVVFITATNRKQDKAHVTGILEPVKGRFVIIELEPDVTDWIAWALGAGVPIELIAFIRFRPELLNKFEPTPDITNSPTPRNVAMIGKLLTAGIDPDLEYAAFSGAAGEGFAAEFLGFLKIWRNLPDPDAGQEPNPPGTVLDAPAGTDAAQEQADQKIAMVQATAAATARGTMPGNLARLVEEIVNPKQDWKTILRDFVERSARNDYNWTRPNPRYLHSGFILPSLISDELRPLVVAIDTSGSIDHDLLAEFAAECTGILETFNTTIHVLYIDSELQHREEFTQDNLPVKFDARGGGGTDFRPAFDFANAPEGTDAPAALIYFTDLEGTFPDRAPDYPVLWIDFNPWRRITPPFGEVVAAHV